MNNLPATKEKEIADKVVSIKEKADAIIVKDQASYDLADSINKAARDEKKAFHVWFDPIDETSKRNRQATIAQGKAIDDPLDYVVKVTGTKQAAWYRAEQARIAEEKRVAEDIARKAAEEAQLAAAEQLAEAGMTAAADAVMEAAPVIEKVVIAGPSKAEGVSYRTTYSAEVVSLIELVKAVAEGRASIACINADMVVLNSLARASKGTFPIPGVRVVTSDVMARR